MTSTRSDKQGGLMPAYVITYLQVTDPKAFEAYRKVAGRA
jgi:uncharacterized protein (DUF1330 family)